MTRHMVLIFVVTFVIGAAIALLWPTPTGENGAPPEGASVKELETELRDIEAIQR